METYADQVIYSILSYRVDMVRIVQYWLFQKARLYETDKDL